MDLNHSPVLEQKQFLSPTMLESLKILSMPITDLIDFVNEERNANPLLEFYDQPQYLTSRIDDGEDSPILDVPAPQENIIEELLLSQLDLGKYNCKEVRIIRSIIGLLDSKGRLTKNAAEVATILDISVTNAAYYIKLLKSLAPKGIAAASLEECLILQLPWPYNTDVKLHTIIKEYLYDLAGGKVRKIANAVGISIDQIQRYIEIIKTLNPYPLNGYDTENIQYVIPDVIASFECGCWKIEVNNGQEQPLCVSGTYKKLMDECGNEQLQKYFSEKVHRINFINEIIEKRRDLLQKVSLIICQTQEDYILGQSVLKPLSMAKIAEELETHVSTISRCVKDKYIQTPARTYKMSALFSSWPNVVPSKNNTGRDYVKKQISIILGSMEILSDDKISQILLEKGIRISRRTVAKYRNEMGITGSYSRKYLGGHKGHKSVVTEKADKPSNIM